MKVAFEGPVRDVPNQCSNCANLEGHVSWWCMSEDARDARGTAIPGCIGCAFFTRAPFVSELKVSDGYVVFDVSEAEGNWE